MVNTQVTPIIGSCGVCIGGNTNLLNCVSDTIKATKVICDSNAIKRDTLLTGILNSVESTSQMINLRDSSSIRKFEVGLSINRAVPNGTPINVVANYKKNGSSRNVALTITQNTRAGVHVHQFVDSLGNKSVDGPSPLVTWDLMDNWIYYPQYRRFIAHYVVSGDTLHKHDYAISISDTAQLKAFYLLYPKESMIDIRDSISLNDTTKILNLQKNDWYGSDTAMKTFQGQYNQAVKDFRDEGYPKEYLEDYANVYMLSKYNVGVKMFRKEDGEFKELNFYDTIDSFGKKHKKISICQ